MKLRLSCPECQKEKTNTRVTDPATEVKVDIQDNGLYEVTCENNHTNLISLQNPKFEIIFEMAAFALLDAYYREAVTGFAATIERLHEFSIQVLCDASQVPTREFEKAWKTISKQSERQFGAFIFCFLLNKKCNISNITDTKFQGQKFTLSQFRNKVIHQGYIPTYTEAVEFGDIVLKYGRNVIKQLRQSFPESFSRVFRDEQLRKEKVTSSSILIGTLLNSALSSDSISSQNLETELKTLQRLQRINAHSIVRN